MNLWFLHWGSWCGLPLSPGLCFLEQTSDYISFRSGPSCQIFWSCKSHYALFCWLGFWLTLAEQGRHFPDLIALWARELPPLSFPGLVSGCHLGRPECLEEPENSVSALMPEIKSVTRPLEMKKWKIRTSCCLFFFFEKWILFKPFQSKGLNFMDEDLCFHWMRNRLSEPAAEDSKESWCLLWQWVLRGPSSIPAAKVPHCDRPVVLTCPWNPRSYTLETAFCPKCLRQGPGFMNSVPVSERQQMQWGPGWKQ